MFPYLPVKSNKANGMAFEHVETGEIFDFDASWRTHLDRVEQILMDNHFGDYITYQR